MPSSHSAPSATWRPDSGASACDIQFDKASLQCDLDPEVGGTGLPSAHDLLDAALAACTTLTLQLYLKRKGWTIEALRVEVTHQRVGAVYQMLRNIYVTGALDSEQQASVLRIADACPVHKTLMGEIAINTVFDQH
ncbi:MAG TPA: OsmC family protein [Burkholderiaceae bacterium]|jgi:putative redox protein